MAATRNQYFLPLTIEFNEVFFLVPTMPGRARHSVRAEGGSGNGRRIWNAGWHSAAGRGLPALPMAGQKTQPIERQRPVPPLQQNILQGKPPDQQQLPLEPERS